jgi:DNA-binding CsgD family transcriptional regulator
VAPVDRLLERDTVLAELERCRRAAARGCGRMVLLRGEAGVGKTAVIARFIAGLGQRARVVRGWCDALVTPRPLGPLIDMLDEMPAEPAAPLRAAIDAGDPRAIYRRLIHLFGRETAWVCVIEDAHWADGATLDLLRFLARRIESLPVLLVVSYRDDEIGQQHPLAAMLGDLATCAVSRIGLAPLSPAAVAELAVDTGINADALHQITGGNPFFVTEVLAARPPALDDGALPRSVSEAVRGRLARLSASGRETAQATSVCGPRASLALLEAVCVGAAALTECIDAGVLVADGDTILFRHELARRATVEQIPDFQRRVLHKRALTVLAEPPVDPNMLAALAFHADQAGDTDAVVHYAPTAAERAARLGANREAAGLYALVLRHAEGISDKQKVVWLEQHQFTSYLSGLGRAAMSSCQEAIALRHRSGDRLKEGDNLRWLSHMLWPLGRTAEAVKAGQASLRLLEDFGPCQQLAWSLVNVAEMAAFGYDPACVDYASRAITVGNQIGDAAVVLRARSCAALTTVMATDKAWDQLEAVWRDAMGSPQLTAHIGACGAIMSAVAAMHHDLSRAEAYITETCAACGDRDLGMFAALAIGAAALVGLHRGEWTRAVAAADDVLTSPGLTPLHRILPLVVKALIAARRGEQAVAVLLDEALGAAETDDLFRLGSVWAARAEAAWLAGDDDTARVEAQAGLAAVTEHSDPWLVGHLQRWAYLAGGDPDDVPMVDDITPYRFEIGGDWRAAVAEWSRLGCPYDAAVAQLGGDIDAVQAALDTFRQLGARAAARRAHQRLARLRGRNPDLRRKHTSADPHGLTRRQRDVLELVAAGHSDAEIATALCISPKTANTHVCAIMAKLGVHNRTQAAAYAHRQLSSPRP